MKNNNPKSPHFGSLSPFCPFLRSAYDFRVKHFELLFFRKSFTIYSFFCLDLNLNPRKILLFPLSRTAAISGGSQNNLPCVIILPRVTKLVSDNWGYTAKYFQPPGVKQRSKIWKTLQRFWMKWVYQCTETLGTSLGTAVVCFLIH